MPRRTDSGADGLPGTTASSSHGSTPVAPARGNRGGAGVRGDPRLGNQRRAWLAGGSWAISSSATRPTTRPPPTSRTRATPGRSPSSTTAAASWKQPRDGPHDHAGAPVLRVNIQDDTGRPT